MAVIKCPHCGKETIDLCDVCLKCGKKINEAPQKISSVERKSGINIKLIIIPLIILLIVSGGFLILKIFDIKNNTEPASINKNTNQSVGSAENDYQNTFASASPAAPTKDTDQKIDDSNIYYDEYWGMDTTAVEAAFGSADRYEDSSLIYENVSFGVRNADLTCKFDNDYLYVVVVSFPEITDTIESKLRYDSLKQLLENKYGTAFNVFAESSASWKTSKTNISLRMYEPDALGLIKTEISYISKYHEPDENANIDYGEYWGMDMQSIIDIFGEPDSKSPIFMQYNNKLFEACNCSVAYRFEDNALYSVLISFNTDYGSFYAGNPQAEGLKNHLTYKYGESADNDSSYVLWTTDKTEIWLWDFDDLEIEYISIDPQVVSSTVINANMDYDEMWGMNMQSTVDILGEPDTCEENYMTYYEVSFLVENMPYYDMPFASYNTNVTYAFENDKFDYAVVSLNNVTSNAYSSHYIKDVFSNINRTFDNLYGETSDTSDTIRTWESSKTYIYLLQPNPEAIYSTTLKIIYHNKSTDSENATQSPPNAADIDYDEIWGMDLQSFKNIYGDPDANLGNGRRIYNDILFDEYDSNVTYKFGKLGLYSAIVSFEYAPDMLLRYEKTKQLLCDKFGEPLSNGAHTNSHYTSVFYSATWKTDKTFIKLDFTENYKGKETIEITYQNIG